MTNNPDILDQEGVELLLANISNELQERIEQNSYNNPIMIGIKTGGLWVAEYLHNSLGITSPLGELNIAFYRDDFSTIGMHPEVRPSQLPVNVNNRHIILIDDVLFTGRTIKAAMNEIFDYGRPASITLAVLMGRNGRELPIQADVIGKTLTLDADKHINLSGPNPLMLEII